ncbi:MAG: TPM domain-containing protein [Leptospira sp.]|nr:TPM domain-containing protein [Leptospira sp.]NCS93011.1 TPM domain-containing protein [Leptospira sp.]
MKFKFLIFSLSFLVFHTTSILSLEVPPLEGRFIDLAYVTDDAFQSLMENRLIDHERNSSNQIAVLIIPTLEGEILEEYSLKVVESWKLGQKDKDNGVLMLIAIKDRKMRIEVGYGLEGDLPDIICKRILDNKLKPNFKKGNYAEGIQEGIETIITAIGKSYTNEEANFYDPNSDYYATSNQGDFANFGPLSILDGLPYESDIPWFFQVFVSAFFLLVVGIFTYIAAFTPYVGWFIAAFLVPFWAIFPSAILGKKYGIPILFTYLALMISWKIFALVSPWGRKKMNNFSPGSSSGSKGGWSSSGGGFSSSGSSSSSSSFGGGGGSFGGGGSSSSW